MANSFYKKSVGDRKYRAARCVKSPRATGRERPLNGAAMSETPSETQPVVVQVDANLKKLSLAALQALAAASAAGAVAWHRKYEAVAAIIQHVPPLYLAFGFSTASAFCSELLQETPDSVGRNIKVAKLTTPLEIAKFTASTLKYAIAYVEAKTKSPIANRGAVDFESLKIQYKRGEKTVTRTLENATREELLEAIGQLCGRAKPAKQSPAAKAAVAAVKDAAVEGVHATATKTQFVLRVPQGS